MGARLSRLSSSSLKTAPHPPRTSSSSPSTQPLTAHPPSSPTPVKVRPAVPDAKRGAEDDWAKLLTSMSGTISSSTWEGSVGIRPRDRDASWHASKQRPEVRAKLPRRRLRGEEEAETLRAKEGIRSEALESIHEALGRDADRVAEERAGRLKQNQLLEFFRLRREEGEKWGVAALRDRYGMTDEDVRNLAFFTRTALPKNVYGATRGVADPEKGVLRFEDMKGSSPADLK